MVMSFCLKAWRLPDRVQLTSFIDLPTLATVHIERSKPTTVAATRVQTNQMAQVEDVCLWRMTNDGNLPRTVRLWRDVISERQPSQHVFVHLLKPQVRPVVGMKKDVCLCLKVRMARLKKMNVAAWNQIEPT